MNEIIVALLAIIAAELGLALLVALGIFGLEFYSLWLRYKAVREDAGLTKIRLSPEEMTDLLGGKGLPEKIGGVKPVSAETAKHGVYI